jgi:hypothetical protein
MGLFDILKKTKQDIDYEEAAKLAEAQASLLGSSAMYITSSGTKTMPVNMGGAGSGGYLSAANQTPMWIDPHTQHRSDIALILMRLRNHIDPVALGAGRELFDYIAAYRYTADKVAVFVCNNGSYVVLEDNTDLFPSDTLITQLRMLQK